MWIVQISDLHITPEIKEAYKNKILDELAFEINKTVSTDEKIIVAICGDIINQGIEQGYNISLNFLKNLRGRLKGYDLEFLLCPGNHDIVNKNFVEFDKFSYELTGNSNNLFQKECVYINEIEDTAFILVNDIFHGDHTYGEVEINKLAIALDNINKKNKIIILHHHLIPINKRDRSTVVNAYEVIKLAEIHKVSLILHGHQHMQMGLMIGNHRCNIIGVGSLLTNVGTGYSNQFNLIKFQGNKVENAYSFKFNQEDSTKGYLGSFNKNNIKFD